MSFIFGGDTGATAEQLKRRRAIAQAMAARGGMSAPRDIGQGLNAIGQALFGVIGDKMADKEIKRRRAEYWDPIENPEPAPQAATQPATQPSTMAEKAPGTPATFEEALPGILEGESGGDYSALYGYANRPGGKFEDVDVENMTVAEVMEFTRPDGPYAQWVKSQIGHVATPVGGLQIVGATLRDAVQNAGIDPSARFSKEIQNQLGRQIFQDQGVDAWVGYKPQGGQAASAQPAQPAQPAAQPAAQPRGAPTLEQLLAASGSGFLDESQQSIVDAMIARRMGGGEAMTPYQQAQIENQQARLALRRRELDARMGGQISDAPVINIGGQPSQRTAIEMYGDPPKDTIWALNPDGTPQIDERGAPIAIPVRNSAVDREIRKEAAEAEEERAAEFDLAQRVVSNIDALLEDENLEYATGWGSYVPLDIPGLNAETRSRMRQIQGQAFLRAYQDLRGGGQITEVEGKKAEQAMARLNEAQTAEEYREALREFRSAFASVLEREGGSAPEPSGDDDLDDEALLEKYGG